MPAALVLAHREDGHRLGLGSLPAALALDWRRLPRTGEHRLGRRPQLLGLPLAKAKPLDLDLDRELLAAPPHLVLGVQPGDVLKLNGHCRHPQGWLPS